LENLLSIFDQNNKTSDQHILRIDENFFSEEYRPVIRKLQEACESKKVRDEMQLEDDFLTELLLKDRAIAKKEKEIAIEKEKSAKKDEELIKKDEALIKKDEEIAKMKEEIAKLLAKK
jgi:exonuclease I